MGRGRRGQDVREAVRELTIPIDDGQVVLAADLMFPAKAVDPFRVLVSTYPYHKDDVIGNVFETPTTAARRRLAMRRCLSTCEGTARRPGLLAASYDLGGVEGADGAAVVEWARRPGVVQRRCRHVGCLLRCHDGDCHGRPTPTVICGPIVAVYGTDDCLVDSIAPGGSPYALGRYSWAAHMIAMDLCPPTRQDSAGRWRSFGLSTSTASAKARATRSNGSRISTTCRSGPPGSPMPSRIEVPTFLIGGWYDLYADAVVRIFNDRHG